MKVGVGAVAQLGERLNGIEEADGSIPFSSTTSDLTSRALVASDYQKFMAGAALVAQGMDHHPEWFNVWNRVRVDLATHDAGGVTALDLKLAHSMEELADRQPKS
jgi:pterin-4a-carbinolamine dehydratase